MDPDTFQSFREQCRRHLLDERTPEGHWEGELSTSALSTATAMVALHCVDSEKHGGLIEGGATWLLQNQNDDGGWGDTTRSFSNISTTLLCWSALRRCAPGSRDARFRSENWIRDYVGSLSPDAIAETVKARYGKDRTFSVPILMLCAICGTLGRRGWKQVLPLPYEMAACPREWFAAMKLPVVSYALPALIAIGRARFEHHPPLPITPSYWIRKGTWPRVSRLLRDIQPQSGGFLEAAPLTAFVTMALASVNRSDHPTAVAGVEFLINSVRPDGSWPIDTNLATWATTLAVKSLTQPGQGSDSTGYDRRQILSWLLVQQYRETHPFTNSPPGGWAWTDLSGGVPDADDTPGAMLALKILADDETAESCLEAAENAAVWLLDLQNDDGGIPTFCKGWGALPFDRSSPDLTAHTIRAWIAWSDQCREETRERIDEAIPRALLYLAEAQQGDGAWLPLWFGNQYRRRDEANPTYGTAMVCRALELLNTGDDRGRLARDLWERGIHWLRQVQNADGGWGSGDGTPSSIEETALAVAALAPVDRLRARQGNEWLHRETKAGTEFPASPIGFYFAKLWYYERIYPLVWTMEALNRFTGERVGAESVRSSHHHLEP